MCFKSRAGQFRHSVANGSPLLQHLIESSCVACRRNDAELNFANSLHTSALYSKNHKRFDSQWRYDLKISIKKCETLGYILFLWNYAISLSLEVSVVPNNFKLSAFHLIVTLSLLR